MEEHLYGIDYNLLRRIDGGFKMLPLLKQTGRIFELYCSYEDEWEYFSAAEKFEETLQFRYDGRTVIIIQERGTGYSPSFLEGKEIVIRHVSRFIDPVKDEGMSKVNLCLELQGLLYPVIKGKRQEQPIGALSDLKMLLEDTYYPHDIHVVRVIADDQKEQDVLDKWEIKSPYKTNTYSVVTFETLNEDLFRKLYPTV